MRGLYFFAILILSVYAKTPEYIPNEYLITFTEQAVQSYLSGRSEQGNF
jgi:hypothetical protein